MKTHGTSYYIWNRFFPDEIKQDVFTLYAFVRVPDDIVDSLTLSEDEKKRDIHDFCRLFWGRYGGNVHSWDLTPALSSKEREPWTNAERERVIEGGIAVCRKYDIPQERVQAFLDAMVADTQQKVYRTYEELQTYMYGSAEVIGLMMCKIIGYDHQNEKEVFRTARLLWEAMQYTNFLRDIREDYVDLGRLYIPEDRLHPYGQTHYLLGEYAKWRSSDGVGTPVPDQREAFMLSQVMLTRDLYAEANKGIALLHPEWRRAVRVASWMYESILDKILRHDGDVFTHSARTTKREKFCTFITRSTTHAFSRTD